MKNAKIYIVIVFCILQMVCNGQPGSIDTSFDAGVGFNGVIHTLRLQSDHKIIVGGDFTNFRGIASNRITRLETNGDLDVGFLVGSGCNGWVQSLAIQNDGKIILVGGFTSFNGNTRRYIVRLNSNGSIDTSFNIGSGANFPILAVAIQSDGKIIIGGGFTSFNGTSINRIARLNIDGSLDSSFLIGTGVDNSISTIAIQNDGKIILGGEFTNFNGTAINRIARVNTNGTIDATFTTVTGANNAVWNAQVLPDGKIIISGLFTMYNGLPRNYITRLHQDGNTDITFNIGIGANNGIRALAYQTNDKLIIGGNFTLFNSITNNRILRLNPDGTSDSSFTIGAAANNNINALAVQPDGDIILGGNFTSFNSVTKNRIVRLKGDVVLSTIDFQENNITMYPNPVNTVLNMDLNSQNFPDQIELYDTLGRKVEFKFNQFTSQIDVSHLSEGVYAIIIRYGKANFRKNIVKKNQL